MSEEIKQQNNKQQNTGNGAAAVVAKSVYGAKRNTFKNRPKNKRDETPDGFDQQIIDIARVTRVMAGGKRMRFRVCMAIGNKKGEVAIGLAKGADVAIAVNKAVNKAKKNIIKVPIVNGTIPHEVFQKEGAAKVLLKPGRKGRGVIAGGAVRVVLELAGVRNVTSKILGTNNKVNNVKCVIAALRGLKKVGVKEKNNKNKQDKAGKNKK